MSKTTSSTTPILEMRTLVQQFSEGGKQSPKSTDLADQIPALAATALEDLDPSSQHYPKIFEALKSGTKALLDAGKIMDAATLTDKAIDVMEEHKVKVLGPVAQEMAKYFLETTEAAAHVTGEDILNRVTFLLEDEERFEEAGNIYFEVGRRMSALERHEQSTAMIGRALSFYQDAGMPDKTKEMLMWTLEKARELAVQQRVEALTYIEKANEITRETGIEFNDKAINLALENFSEHLLNTALSDVRSKFVYYGRTHKRKRKLFGKKKGSA